MAPAYAAAPEEIPTSNPSVFANALAVSIALSLSTVITYLAPSLQTGSVSLRLLHHVYCSMFLLREAGATRRHSQAEPVERVLLWLYWERDNLLQNQESRTSQIVFSDF